ncbi:MAG: YgiQ family radical SAM protein, partial [Pseudomonadales bacterium]|nr:YgiQ family radical SAM protein [Pseudomonadales bacterium]
AGNMDSMINHYTADKRPRSDDAYSPDAKAGLRPDRATIIYSQRCREAYKGVPIVIGGIEASLRRIAHFDYWSEKVRRSMLMDSKADILVHGNGERQVVEIAGRLARGERVGQLLDIRGTAVSTPVHQLSDKAVDYSDPAIRPVRITGHPETRDMIRIPSYEQVCENKDIYAHASRLFHNETNPGNGRAILQAHGNRDVLVNPPALALSTEELDAVFDLPYSRLPHPRYQKSRFPAYEMIRFSVNIMRGCFGGCSFCSITEHEGRAIQSRSENSIIREVERIRDETPGFTGTISDLGGPTANMWRLDCKDKAVEASCRRDSCIYPTICSYLETDQTPLIHLYRRARELPGIKRVNIASGLRYDLAVKTPEYVKELVTHHVGGYLKIAPEHSEKNALELMLKPGMDSYYEFEKQFRQFSREAGKEQYLIPYFIAGHPGSRDEDMLNLALWLKKHRFQLDQVQNFIPSPMARASTMYYTRRNPMKRLKGQGDIYTARGDRERRVQKAFLRYHDPENWPLLRATLQAMGRKDLIGSGRQYLVPQREPTPIDSRIKGAEAKYRAAVNRLLYGGEKAVTENPLKKQSELKRLTAKKKGWARARPKPGPGRNKKPR